MTAVAYSATTPTCLLGFCEIPYLYPRLLRSNVRSFIFHSTVRYQLEVYQLVSMIRGVAYWFVVFCINVLFPPLAVMIVAGPGMDTILNCLFFLLGVIPSHIHGFYMTCTYFSRRRKVSSGLRRTYGCVMLTTDTGQARQIPRWTQTSYILQARSQRWCEQ